MSTHLRSKRVLVPAIAAVTVTAVGGGAWAAIAPTDDVRGSERDRVVAAVADGGRRWPGRPTPRPATTGVWPTRSRSARPTAAKWTSP